MGDTDCEEGESRSPVTLSDLAGSWGAGMWAQKICEVAGGNRPPSWLVWAALAPGRRGGLGNQLGGLEVISESRSQGHSWRGERAEPGTGRKP